MGAHTHTNSAESGSLQFILHVIIRWRRRTLILRNEEGQINGTAAASMVLVWFAILSGRAGVPNFLGEKDYVTDERCKVCL